MNKIFSLFIFSIIFISCSPGVEYVDSTGEASNKLIDNNKILLRLSYLSSTSYDEGQEYWKDKLEVLFNLHNRDKVEPIEITDIDVLIIKEGKDTIYSRIDTNFKNGCVNRMKKYKTNDEFLLEKEIIRNYRSDDEQCENDNENCHWAYIWFIYDKDDITADKIKLQIKLTLKQGEEITDIQREFDLKRDEIYFFW